MSLCFDPLILHSPDKSSPDDPPSFGNTRLGWAVGGPPGMWRLGSHAQGDQAFQVQGFWFFGTSFPSPSAPPQSCLGAKATQAPVIWYQPRSARPEGNTTDIFLFKFDFYFILKYSWLKFFFHCKAILIHLHIQRPHYSFGNSTEHTVITCLRKEIQRNNVVSVCVSESGLPYNEKKILINYISI